MEEMNSSNNNSNYSSNSSNSIKMDLWDSKLDLASSIAAEVSSYDTEIDNDDDAVLYQFKPSTELLDSSSEESDEEGKEMMKDYSTQIGKDCKLETVPAYNSSHNNYYIVFW